jgi:hypothetical protein
MLRIVDIVPFHINDDPPKPLYISVKIILDRSEVENMSVEQIFSQVRGQLKDAHMKAAMR